MWSGATPTWLAALGGPHGVYVHAEVWYAGVKVTDIPIGGGSVKVTARNRVRRTAEVNVPESWWPTDDTDAIAPYGAQLRIWRGIVGADATLVGGSAPQVFTGRIETVSRDVYSGTVGLKCSDPAVDINDAQFESPRVGTYGLLITTAIRQLIIEVWPAAVVVDLTDSAATIPAGIMWDTDRGKAVDDLAASIGAEVFCLPDGVTWYIRPVPTLSGTAGWTITDGQGGTLVSDSRSMSRIDVANRVIVHVERPGVAPLLVPVTDDSPTSTTRYGGPYGKVVRHWAMPVIGTVAQATTAGRARLARTIGITRTRDITCVPNPALEAGDLIGVDSVDGSGLHIADEFSLPLSIDGAMSIATRSTQIP